MTAANVSLVNALLLLVVGALGYFLPEDPSPTALIPVGFGVLLLVLNPGVRAANKAIAHVAVVATLLILLGLMMPLRGAIGREDTAAVVRVSVMLLSTVVALVFYVKSFIDVRKARAREAEAAGQ